MPSSRCDSMCGSAVAGECIAKTLCRAAPEPEYSAHVLHAWLRAGGRCLARAVECEDASRCQPKPSAVGCCGLAKSGRRLGRSQVRAEGNDSM